MNGNTAKYDAENRLVQVTEAPAYGGGMETLAYDGTGQRVEKQVSGGGGTVVYVYDAFGQTAAEYSSASGDQPPCGTCYLSSDDLGSVRMVTDQNANVVGGTISRRLGRRFRRTLRGVELSTARPAMLTRNSRGRRAIRNRGSIISMPDISPRR